jgi:catechol 2,3-dioxygenase
VLGFNIACRYPGANFYGSGGYHHQVATNIWASRGAGPIPENAAGLAAFEIVAEASSISAIAERAERAGAAAAHTDGLTVRDPWNIPIKLRLG